MPTVAVQMRAADIARQVATGLTFATALSCSGPTEPRHIAAAFALVRIAGEALPTYAYVTPGFPSTVIADTLRMNLDGTGASVSVERREPPAPDAPQLHRNESTFQYRIEGARVEISFDCPPLASCVAPPHMVGRLTGDGIRFDYVLSARVPQDYVILGGQ
jgi:hypothetical protein